MKQKALAVLLSIFSLAAITYADSSDSHSITPSAHESKKPPFREYDNRISFIPTYLSYERIKPNAIYVGVGAYANYLINKSFTDLFFDSEVRLGYNFFFRGRDHFTPVVGAGFTQIICIDHDRCSRRPNINYALIGLRYWHEFSAKFNMGLNGAFLYGRPTKENHHWTSPVIGCDISIPILFRFAKRKNWDVCIEPYTMYLRGGDASAAYVGFRNSIGYRF